VGRSDLECIHFVLGPKSHIVNYPLNKEGDVSFVAVKKEEGKFSESWREEGTYNSFLNDFALYDPAIFPTIENSQKLYKWGIYVRPPLKSMICENITLLGDAAHPMVPFLGQGGCMAIEDAYSFGILCKKAEGDFQRAQNVYDSIRSKRTKLIQRLSRTQANIYHMQNPIVVAARNAALKFSFIPIYELKKIHIYDAHNHIVKNTLKF
jgi:salicylate hydroxylase